MNGEALALDDRASALANYPHVRRAGGFLYVSGTSSRRPDNTHQGAEQNEDGTWTLSIEEQTRGVLENISVLVNRAGASLANLVDVTVFLTDMKYYAGMNSVYNEYFNSLSGPTRTTVAVFQLPHPNLLIEIKALALDPLSIQSSSSSSK